MKKLMFNGHVNGITEERLNSLERLTNALKTFCIDNADNIISCEWIYSPYCMKNCKFYHKEVYAQCGTEIDSYLEKK